MSGSERRYRWLLLAYPRSYRQYRADEMLETLLSAVDDNQGRPSRREALALLVGGLRARSGVDRLGSRAALHRSALRLSVLSLLVYAMALAVPPALAYVLVGLGSGVSGLGTWSGLVPVVATVVALVAAAWSRYRLAFAVTVVAAGAQLCFATLRRTLPAPQGQPDVVLQFGPKEVFSERWEAFQSLDGLLAALDVRFWAPMLAAVALLPLLRAPRTFVARPWTWLVVTLVAVITLSPNAFASGIGLPSPAVIYLAIVAILVGAAVDVRVPIVASALLLVSALSASAYELLRWRRSVWELESVTVTVLLFVGLLAGALVASVVTARHRAVL